MCRHDGLPVSAATVLRLLRDEGLLLEASYQRERRQLAARRKAAFAIEPTGPNQVWQLDFTEFETTTGGTWRLAGCRDYWSKYELGWHVSPTANQHDAIAAVELALTEAERLAGRPLRELAQCDADGRPAGGGLDLGEVQLPHLIRRGRFDRERRLPPGRELAAFPLVVRLQQQAFPSEQAQHAGRGHRQAVVAAHRPHLPMSPRRMRQRMPPRRLTHRSRAGRGHSPRCQREARARA